ncbi:MAG: polya polymerase [Desulfobulbaceae bacterium]|nr:polya polymerase [Desulfobulbaceae bacterium]
MLEANDLESGMSQGAAGNIEPVVIPESGHPIRVHDLDKEALKVLYRLRDAGFSGYLVGGGVRDLYLGKRPKDFDISTNARPGQIRKIFRNSRTIGRRFRLVQVYFRGGKIIEVSTLRSQSEFDINNADKVLPSNNTFGTLVEDAFRRDLTINSLFYEIENRTIIDYVGGVKDLDQGIVRIVGEPDRRMTRDPVRMLRAVRHAARNDFRIEPHTWKAIIDNCEKLNLCPPSRIRDELLKDLRGGSSEAWTRIVLECGIFYTLFPLYREMLTSRKSDVHKKLLLSLFGVVDRLGRESARGGLHLDIPDHFLLALLLLPWAMEKFDLLQQRQKKQAFYHLSREIRSGIDEFFTEGFSLKRMTKESMAMLLVNLATFARHHQKKNWPKWLRNKSYFDDCFRFYSLLAEAQGHHMTDDKLFAGPPPGDSGDNYFISDQKNGNGRSRGRRGTRPAFTNRKQGVFGLRNK